MHMHGIVMTADLEEVVGDAEAVELRLTVQGVGPGQPRKIIVPLAVLVENPEIDPEVIRGHAFQAEVEEVAPKRWVVSRIGFAANRVLREEAP